MNQIYSLPYEILELICFLVKNINLLNTCTLFRRKITTGTLFDYLVEFGYDVDIGSLETVWYLDEKIHRVNGPAIESINGEKSWYRRGILHREDGPAIINNEGQVWYKNGLIHRKKGPAVISSDGTKQLFHNGKHHNVDGPAIVWPNGGKEWFIDGKRHRLNGPAIISPGKAPL